MSFHTTRDGAFGLDGIRCDEDTKRLVRARMRGRGRGRRALMSAVVAVATALIVLVTTTAFTIAPANATPRQTSVSPVVSPQQHLSTLTAPTIAIRFRNRTTSTVSVAVMYWTYSEACGKYGGWATKGWWNLDPGELKTAVNSRSTTVYYYARSNDGQYVWAGDEPQMYVTDDAFDSCRNITQSTWERVGLRTIQVSPGVKRSTVNLR